MNYLNAQPILETNSIIVFKKYKQSFNNEHIKKIRDTKIDSIYPMILIFRVFGIAPYKFDDNNRLIASFKYMIFSFTNIVIYSCAIYSVLSKIITPDARKTSAYGDIEICKVKLNEKKTVQINFIKSKLFICN